MILLAVFGVNTRCLEYGIILNLGSIGVAVDTSQPLIIGYYEPGVLK